jgi:hypothetical protein
MGVMVLLILRSDVCITLIRTVDRNSLWFHLALWRRRDLSAEVRGAGIDAYDPAGRAYPTGTIIMMKANDLVTPDPLSYAGIPGRIPLKSTCVDRPGQSVEGLGRPALLRSAPAGTLMI